MSWGSNGSKVEDKNMLHEVMFLVFTILEQEFDFSENVLRKKVDIFVDLYYCNTFIGN